METSIIKSILCSGIVLGLYHIILSKEKIYTFNRFYLLIGLTLSLVIPYISLNFFLNETPIFETVEGRIATLELTSTILNKESFDWKNILWTVYFLVCILMLIRLITSIVQIKSIKGKYAMKNDTKIIISNNIKSPFSFWKTMYLPTHHWMNGNPTSEIFIHEKNHINNLHTLDLIFLECLKILFWFNPFIYFYKKAILMNHEFLADESVIQKNKDLSGYQHTILDEIKIKHKNQIIHKFNYNNTKKRFIMMTTTKSKFATIKKGLTIGALAFLTVGFSQSTYAQEKRESVIKSNTKNATEAIFPGGNDALRMAIAEEFNSEKIEDYKEVQTSTAYFTIDKKGNLLKIETKGKNKKMNNELKRCLSKVTKNKQWTPATKNGSPVDYIMKLPVSMAPPQFSKSIHDIKDEKVRRKIQEKINEIKK